mgnify:FL=1
MFKPDRHHIIIAVKTLAVQALLFCSILLVVWGSQKLYGLIDQTRFPVPYQVTVTEGMTDEQKGKELIDALTARMRYELNSTFGWSANDILFNPYVLDNRAYRQFGTYSATKTLLDHYSTARENQSLYDARVNDFTFGPKRWGYFFVPSAESAYKRGLKRVEKYKQELDEGKAIYNCRTDDIYSAFNLILGESMFGHALGLLENSQQLPFYTLDNRIYEAQGIMLVVRDYVKAIYDLYPEIAAKNNEANMKEAMVYLDRICDYDPMYITSSFNSGELIISYMLFARNRLSDIRDSIRI